jgi:aspartate aminotransferase
LNLVGKKTSSGVILESQSAVTSYILGEAKIAVVPFSAFGASADNSWYRLSVGTSIKEEIPAMLAKLEAALEQLS